MTNSRTLSVVVAILVLVGTGCRRASPVPSLPPAEGPERDRSCQEIALQCYQRRAPSVALSRCREISREADGRQCRGHHAECLEACRAATDELELVVPVPDGAKR